MLTTGCARYVGIGLVVLLALSLRSVADPTQRLTCDRVLGEPDFARHALPPDVSGGSEVMFDSNGDDELELWKVTTRFGDDGSRLVAVHRVVPDGTGSVALGPGVELEPIDSKYVFPRAFMAGDLDGDGFDDLVIYSQGGYGVSERHLLDVLLSDGTGSFRSTTRTEIADRFASYPVLVDLDADGARELAIAFNRSWDWRPRIVELFVFEPTSEGWLTPLARETVLDLESRWLAAADLDGSGFERIVVLSEAGWGDAAAKILSLRRSRLRQTVAWLPFRPVRMVGADLGAGRRELLATSVRWQPNAATILHRLAESWNHVYEVDRIELDSDLRGAYFGILDVDGDGADDFLFHYKWLWFGSRGTEIVWGSPLGFEVANLPRARVSILGTIDVDDDGLHDLLIASGGESIAPAVAEREYDFGSAVTPFLAAYDTFLTSAVGDVNHDRMDDLLLHEEYPPQTVLGLPTGTGKFVVEPIVEPDHYTHSDRFVDTDGDGTLDIWSSSYYEGEQKARGRGDGSFESWERVDLPDETSRPRLVDLDGDGVLDAVATVRDPVSGLVSVHAFLDRGGVMVFADEFETTIEGYGLALVADDFDGDGLGDVAYTSSRGEDPDWSLELALRRFTAEGTFGEEEPLLEEPYPARLRGWQVVDFDLDRAPDFFLELDGSHTDAPLVGLRNRGDGSFEPMWRIGWEPPSGRARLEDVNRDGLPDLVSSQAPAVVRLGDGFGDFGPELGPWAVHPTVFGRFHGSEPAGFASHYELGSGVYVETYESRGRVLPADVEPPTARTRIVPVVDFDHSPPRFEGVYEVVSIPEDECDGAPVIIDRRVGLPDLELERVTFHRSAARRIEIYAVPRESRGEVLLLGQDEKEMLDLWAEVLDGGGVAYRDHEPLRLASSRAYGPESGPTLTGSRLTWRATFGGSGQLAAVWAGSPTGTLPLLVTASDASGKIGVTVHPFEQLKASARARACDDPGLAPWVCP